jgi:hypothetical protein
MPHHSPTRTPSRTQTRIKLLKKRLQNSSEVPIAWTECKQLHVFVPDDAMLVCPSCYTRDPKCKNFAYKFANYGQNHGPARENKDSGASPVIKLVDVHMVRSHGSCILCKSRSISHYNVDIAASFEFKSKGRSILCNLYSRRDGVGSSTQAGDKDSSMDHSGKRV